MRRASNSPAKMANTSATRITTPDRNAELYSGRIGLICRQLGKDEPSRRRHLGIGAQDAAPSDVDALHVDALEQLIGLVSEFSRTGGLHPRKARAGRLHLLKPGHVGLPQHLADIRMRDQTCRLINHVSLTVLADLYLRYDVPNESEIHLSDDYAEFRSNAGHGNRHVRLRLGDEVNRPIIDFVGHCLNKRGIVRMIHVAFDDIGRLSGHAELLASRRIELHDFAQRGHLMHQANCIELPVI